MSETLPSDRVYPSPRKPSRFCRTLLLDHPHSQRYLHYRSYQIMQRLTIHRYGRLKLCPRYLFLHDHRFRLSLHSLRDLVPSLQHPRAFPAYRTPLLRSSRSRRRHRPLSRHQMLYPMHSRSIMLLRYLPLRLSPGSIVRMWQRRSRRF